MGRLPTSACAPASRSSPRTLRARPRSTTGCAGSSRTPGSTCHPKRRKARKGNLEGRLGSAPDDRSPVVAPTVAAVAGPAGVDAPAVTAVIITAAVVVAGAPGGAAIAAVITASVHGAADRDSAEIAAAIIRSDSAVIAAAIIRSDPAVIGAGAGIGDRLVTAGERDGESRGKSKRRKPFAEHIPLRGRAKPMRAPGAPSSLPRRMAAGKSPRSRQLSPLARRPRGHTLRPSPASYSALSPSR